MGSKAAEKRQFLLIVENGKLVSEMEDFETPSMRGSVNVKWIEEDDLELMLNQKTFLLSKLFRTNLLQNRLFQKQK